MLVMATYFPAAFGFRRSLCKKFQVLSRGVLAVVAGHGLAGAPSFSAAWSRLDQRWARGLVPVSY